MCMRVCVCVRSCVRAYVRVCVKGCPRRRGSKFNESSGCPSLVDARRSHPVTVISRQRQTVKTLTSLF